MPSVGCLINKVITKLFSFLLLSRRVEGGKLMWNVEFPGMVVEHSTNGGKSWCEEQETDICGEILLKAK